MKEMGEKKMRDKKLVIATLLISLLASLPVLSSVSAWTYSDGTDGAKFDSWGPRIDRIVMNTSSTKNSSENVNITSINDRLAAKYDLHVDATGDGQNDFDAESESVELVIGINDMRYDAHSELASLLAEKGGKIISTVCVSGKVIAAVVNAPSDSASLVKEIESKGLSEYIESNVAFKADFDPNDPDWPLQWGSAKIEANQAWNKTLGSQSVLLAVIDTGIDYSHPDLQANYAAFGYDWVNNDTDPMDDQGHGTHVAGIIGAVANNSIGIAGTAQVRMMAEKGLDKYGSGYADDLAKAIIHATDVGAKIISMSWGASFNSELIYEAIRYAHDAGVLLIAAAGNDDWSVKHYPAAYDEVVAVSATDEHDESAWFTNFGNWIELAAPGVLIYSTFLNNTYKYLSGTSMATPFVSGTAALIWSQFSNMTANQVRAQLRRTAEDLGNLGFDEFLGYGIVNARKAVEEMPFDHDLAVWKLKATTYAKPGHVAYVNAAVLNLGGSGENDLTVQLLVDGVVQNSLLISNLSSGEAITVDFSWVTTVEGIYNVSVYAVPAPFETTVEDNALSAELLVRIAEVVYVPTDFTTIKEAIDVADPDFTVYVGAGVYYENLVLYEPLVLTGQNPSATFIDGNGTSAALIVFSTTNVSITGFTVQNNAQAEAIWLLYSSGSVISNNTISDSTYGILLQGSEDNYISDNIVKNSFFGIRIEYSSHNSLKNNKIMNNAFNFGVFGNILPEYINNVESSNTVDGKPVYYLLNESGTQIPSDAGYVAAVNSMNITANDLNLTNNEQGVLFVSTTWSTVTNVTAYDNNVGIELLWNSTNNILEDNALLENNIGLIAYFSDENELIRNRFSGGLVGAALSRSKRTLASGNLLEKTVLFALLLEWYSDNNTVARNTIANNMGSGMFIVNSVDNMVYQNNFINNTSQVRQQSSGANRWDNGLGRGNYWSDYNGRDLNGDGVGDTDLPHLGKDYYPLMHPWEPLRGDTNVDGIVDIFDLVIIAIWFGYSVPPAPEAIDTDGNNSIDLCDLVVAATNFGRIDQ